MEFRLFLDPSATDFFTILLIIGDITLGLSLLSVLAGLAHDIQRRSD